VRTLGLRTSAVMLLFGTISALAFVACDTTELAAFPPAGSVWHADHETGSGSQWPNITTNWDDAGCKDHRVVDYENSIGQYAMKMTIDQGSLDKAGCRQARLPEAQSGKTYVYEVSYYLPQKVATLHEMWNVFQYKSTCSGCSGSDPMFTVGFEGNSTPTVHLNWKGGNYGLAGPFATSGVQPNQQWDSAVAVPFGRWNELSVLLDQSTAFDGHITVWFNGVKLFDFANVRTGYDSGDMRWSVNNYSNGLTLDPYTLYIDNASIRTP
jgi:Polysaccharide lyase